jgi:thymidine kinase
MWANKTNSLIKEMDDFRLSGVPTLVIKPRLDTRYSNGTVASHDGNRRAATLIGDNEELERVLNFHAGLIQALIVDEVQFFDPSLISHISRLVNSGIEVICGGLDMDCFGDWFPTSLLIRDMADYNVALCAKCKCGSPASRTQRFDPEGTPVTSGDVVAVGAEDLYRPVCLDCWVGPND